VNYKDFDRSTLVVKPSPKSFSRDPHLPHLIKF